MLSDNVEINGVGEFFVRGAVVDKKNEKVNLNDLCLFNGAKEKMAERNLLISDYIVKCDEGFVMVKISMLEGGSKSLHTGTTLGYIEKIEEDLGNSNEAKIQSLSVEERKTVNEILKKIEDKVDKDITSEEKYELMKTLSENEEIFSKHKMDLGKTDVIQHTIETGNAKPIAFKPRKVPIGLEEDMNRMINDLLAAGVVRPSTSPWNFPIVLVKKKNGDIRMCVDYRALNAKTARPIFPIPSSEELFDTIGGAKFFSTLDLSSGYYQVPLNEKDIEKTAFSTKYGQFEFTRMPFGLCSAPATFQKLMNMILQKENWLNCVVYLDDVLIFGRTIGEHNQRLSKVLKRIKDAGLKLAPDKCVFLKTEVNYLGHIINKEGVKTDPGKIESIKAWLMPGCKKELQTFLGFCNYYRRFIKNYASTSERLSAMLKGENNFSWNEDRKAAFYELKELLSSPPVLALPITDGEYILDTDASQNSIGAVLSQRQNGEERVLCYASKAMTKSQRQYCITRKELLAIYTFVLKFKHYLIGTKFLVRTDHQALKWLLKWDSPNTSQYCVWRAELEVFDMTVEYRKGVEHINADAMSRLPPCEQCLLKHSDPKKKRNVKVYKEEELTTEMVTNDGETERALYQIKNENDDWQQDKDKDIQIIRTAMTKNKMEINEKELKAGSTELRTIWSHKKDLRLRGDLLFLYQDDKYRLIIPKSQREYLIKQFHSFLGHPGIEKTQNVIRNEYYWPAMDKTINETLSKCEECQNNKNLNGRIRAPLQNIVSDRPFQTIGIDITGPFRTTKNGHRYILGIIDYFSKYISLIPVSSIEAERMAQEVWIHWISKFGIPERIHSDCGTNFQSKFFKEFCNNLGIRKTATSPYYPQSDGLVERLFGTAKSMISAVLEEKRLRDWSEVLPTIEFGIRTTIQKSTQYSPYEMVFGRKARLPMSVQQPTMGHIASSHEYLIRLKEELTDIHAKVRIMTKKGQEKISDRYNKNRWYKEVKVGDIVLVKNEGRKGFEKKYVGPFEVKAIINQWTYVLCSEKLKKTIRRNYNQIKVINRNIKREYEKEASKTSIWSKHPTVHIEETRRFPIRETRNQNPRYRFDSITEGGMSYEWNY